LFVVTSRVVSKVAISPNPLQSPFLINYFIKLL
jgi:hypothetical protein